MSSSRISQDQLALLTGTPPHYLKQAVDTKVLNTCMAITECPSARGRGVITPDVVYDIKGRTAGYAVGSTLIRLNLQALLKETDSMINQTIPHECAHIACEQWYPRQGIGHGPRWQMLMLELGLPPDRCHSYELTPAKVHQRKWVYSCGCRTHKLKTTKHNRIQKGAIYICNQCHSVIVFSHKAS